MCLVHIVLCMWDPHQARSGRDAPVQPTLPTQGSRCCPQIRNYKTSGLVAAACLPMRSTPSLACHPTCKGTALKAIGPHSNFFRVCQITVCCRRNMFPKEISVEILNFFEVVDFGMSSKQIKQSKCWTYPQPRYQFVCSGT